MLFITAISAPALPRSRLWHVLANGRLVNRRQGAGQELAQKGYDWIDRRSSSPARRSRVPCREHICATGRRDLEKLGFPTTRPEEGATRTWPAAEDRWRLMIRCNSSNRTPRSDRAAMELVFVRPARRTSDSAGGARDAPTVAELGEQRHGALTPRRAYGRALDPAGTVIEGFIPCCHRRGKRLAHRARHRRRGTRMDVVETYVGSATTSRTP